uniref:Uncharacterized protein n=1 Tax=Moniliophthora roreri TaxID=221103 RepID=A0A0W0FEG0_MONRR
MQESGVSM